MNNLDRLLIVDDDQGSRKHLAKIGRRLNFDVATVANQSELERKMPAFWPTVILLDLQMSDSNGIQMLKLLRELNSEAKIILMGDDNNRALATAMQLGEILNLNMEDTLQKPILIDTLREKLNRVRNSRITISGEDLRLAIERGEIRPTYQPKASCGRAGQWRIAAVEALARWHRPDSTVVMPGEFIDVAEQMGLLPDLTHHLLKQVILQLRQWDEKGLSMSASVNVSPMLLSDPKFPDRAQALMDDMGIDCARIVFELTESSVMRNAGLAIEILTRLRNKGFGLAIDDFGTGYSSLEQLYRMPFNELKIDRILVREIAIHSDAAIIVEAIVMLARKLGLSVCAEGVESRQVLTFLEDAGCHTYQGYYVGRPTSAEALLQRVREFESAGLAACTDEPAAEPPSLGRDPGRNRVLPLLSI